MTFYFWTGQSTMYNQPVLLCASSWCHNHDTGLYYIPFSLPPLPSNRPVPCTATSNIRGLIHSAMLSAYSVYHTFCVIHKRIVLYCCDMQCWRHYCEYRPIGLCSSSRPVCVATRSSNSRAKECDRRHLGMSAAYIYSNEPTACPGSVRSIAARKADCMAKPKVDHIIKRNLVLLSGMPIKSCKQCVSSTQWMNAFRQTIQNIRVKRETNSTNHICHLFRSAVGLHNIQNIPSAPLHGVPQKN